MLEKMKLYLKLFANKEFLTKYFYTNKNINIIAL